MLSSTISTSQKVSKVSNLAKLIFTWMIPHCDDYGQMAGDMDSVKWEVIPRIDVPEREIEECLKELEGEGLIKRFKEKDKIYLKISNFDDFQTFKNDRPRQNIVKKNT